MQSFYKILFLSIIAGLFFIIPFFKASAQEIPTTFQEIISSLKNLISISEELSGQLEVKISRSPAIQKIISYVPQDKESFLNLLNRFTDMSSGFNRWLDTTIGINVNVILRFAKNLMVGIIKVMTAAIKEGISLIQ
jgi:hypothetical protein